MTSKRSDRCDDRVHGGGITGFLRTLLAGVPWSDRAEAEELIHLERPAGGVLKVHNANGHTRLRGEDRSDVRVQMRKVARAESEEAAAALLGAIRLASEEIGDALELEVEVPRKWNRRGHAHLELCVPRDLRVEISAVNGRVDVEGLHAPVSIRSSNGAAIVQNVSGDVNVATSNAKVTCNCSCGHLVARSSNGKIEIVDHRGSVDASTSNGLICATLAGVGKAGVQLATSNGRIVLELPEEVDADVDIRVDNGIIRNDRKLCKAMRESNGRVRGRLGSGGAQIRLRTSNGSISLH